MDINALNARFGIAENLVFSEHQVAWSMPKCKQAIAPVSFFFKVPM